MNRVNIFYVEIVVDKWRWYFCANWLMGIPETNQFYCFLRFTSCIEVIEPCVKACSSIFKTFCNQFNCTNALKEKNRLECSRLCHIGFRNTDIYKTRKPRKLKRLLRPKRVHKLKPLRSDSYSYDMDDYNYKTNLTINDSSIKLSTTKKYSSIKLTTAKKYLSKNPGQ